MRSTKIAPGEHYHVFNRGVGKNDIFFDERDKIRFLVSILYFQSSIIISNPSYYVSHFREHRVFPNSKKTLDKILENRVVELVNFCLMPNHFHLTLFEKEEGGISHYMQRIQNAYTKYFNTKYKKSGHLFDRAV